MIGNMGYLGKIFIWMLICMLVVGSLAAAIYIPAGNALENKGEILFPLANHRYSCSNLHEGIDLTQFPA